MSHQRSIMAFSKLALTLPVVLACIGCGSDGGKETEAKMEPSTEQAPAVATASTISDAEAGPMLESALQNMQKVQSYHVVADLQMGEQTAHIDGDLGVGKVRFTVLRFDGLQSKHIVIGSDGYVSTDDGSTWAKDVDGTGAMMSQLITAPIDPAMKMVEEGNVKVIGSEDVEGVSTTHVQVQAATPIDVWIADDPELGKVVRKIHLIVTAAEADAEFDTTVLYGDYNKPLEIVAPM